MIGPAPEFTNSKFFVVNPEWHLKDGASDTDKRELEKFMNDAFYRKLWKEKYPNMKKPYYTWNGKMVDKGVKINRRLLETYTLSLQYFMQ